jgi:hypothetical protein
MVLKDLAVAFKRLTNVPQQSTGSNGVESSLISLFLPLS